MRTELGLWNLGDKKMPFSLTTLSSHSEEGTTLMARLAGVKQLKDAVFVQARWGEIQIFFLFLYWEPEAIPHRAVLYNFSQKVL